MISNSATIKFILVRYIGLIANSSRSLLIASVSGPAIFGIYSILTLAQQQISMSALGMREAVSIELAGEDTQGAKFDEIFNSALVMTFTIGVLLGCISWLFYGFRSELGNINAALGLSYLALLIASVSIITEVLYNVCRVLEKFTSVATCELLYAFGCLAVALFHVFSKQSLEDLFVGFFYVNLSVMLVLLYSVRRYISANFRWERTLFLVGVGVPLMALNVFTVLLTSSGNYLVAAFGSQLESGQYNFAYGISVLFMTGMNTVVWVKFSSAIGEFKENTDHHIRQIIVGKLRDLVLMAAGLFLISTLLFPVLREMWFPEYGDTNVTFASLMAVGFLLLASFPENLLLLAEARRGELIFFSFSSLSITLISFFAIESIGLFSDIKLSAASSLVIGASTMFVLTVLGSAKYRNCPKLEDASYVTWVIFLSILVACSWFFNIQIIVHLIILIGLVTCNISKLRELTKYAVALW